MAALVFLIVTRDGLKIGAVSSAIDVVHQDRVAMSPSALSSFESKEPYFRIVFHPLIILDVLETRESLTTYRERVGANWAVTRQYARWV